jgi:hypothetical protein
MGREVDSNASELLPVLRLLNEAIKEFRIRHKPEIFDKVKL